MKVVLLELLKDCAKSENFTCALIYIYACKLIQHGLRDSYTVSLVVVGFEVWKYDWKIEGRDIQFCLNFLMIT